MFYKYGKRTRDFLGRSLGDRTFKYVIGWSFELWCVLPGGDYVSF